MPRAKGLMIPSVTMCLIAFSSSAIQAKPVVITYWGSGSNHPIEADLAERFNRMNEGKILVKAMDVADVETRVLTAIAGGAAPDCFKLDRFRIGSYAGKNVLMGLDNMLKADGIGADAYFRGPWRETVFGGKVYGLPRNTDSRAMFYNKDLLRQAGINPEAPPKTWDALTAMARRIDRKNAKGDWDRAGFIPHAGNWFFLGWLWAAGGEMTDDSGRKAAWNGPEGLKALTFMNDALRHYGGDERIAPLKDFWSGKLGAIIDGSWTLGNIRKKPLGFDYGIAPPPRPEGLGNDRITWSGGFAYCLPRGCRHPKEAWRFIRFMANDRNAQIELNSRAGAIPVLRSAANDRAFLASDGNLKTFVDLLSDGRNRTVSPAGAEMWAEYHTNLTDMLIKGRKSPQEILALTSQAAQKALDRAWSRVRTK